MNFTSKDRNYLKRLRQQESDAIKERVENFVAMEEIEKLTLIKYMGKATGFPMDFRAPRYDEVAVHAANNVLGINSTSEILSNFKRAHLTLPGLYDDVLGYDNTPVPRPENDPVYIAAYQSVREQILPQIKIIPLDYRKSSKHADLPHDKSPGLPWKSYPEFKTKGDVIGNKQAMNFMINQWKASERTGVKRVRLPDTCVFARTQMSKLGTNKVRATWGYPLSVFLEESRYCYPLLKFLKLRTDDYPIAYGVEMFNGGMQYVDQIFTKGTKKGGRCVMLDWKSFDKTVPAWLIRDVFNILYECFDFTQLDTDNGYKKADPERMHRRWKRMVNYFINTPFRMPDGHRFEKTHGVPSGSGFTSIVDSIVNAIVTRYCCYHTTGAFPMYDIYFGDDSVSQIKGELLVDDIAAVALKTFGMIVNVEKSYTTKDRCNVNFLGYYNNHGIPVRNIDKLWGSILYPEHNEEFPNPALTAARFLGQAYACMSSLQGRKFCQAIKYIQENFELEDNWLQNIIQDRPGIFKLVTILGLTLDQIKVPVYKQGLACFQGFYKAIKRTPMTRNTVAFDLYERFFDAPPLLWASTDEDGENHFSTEQFVDSADQKFEIFASHEELED